MVAVSIRCVRAGGAVPGGGAAAGLRGGVLAGARKDRRPDTVEGRQLDLRPLPPLRQLPRLSLHPRRRQRRALLQVPADDRLQRRRLTQLI